MRSTRMTRTPRALAAGAALGTAAALMVGGAAAPAVADGGADTATTTGVGYNYDPGKQDQPSLTVTLPSGGLPAEGPSQATLTGEGYATSSDAGTTFGGAYTLFGVIELREEEDPGSWAPSKRGVSGVHYDYMGEAGTYQQMVNYPGNTTEPGMPYMDEDGSWTLEDHPVPGARFTSQSGQQIDCLAEGTQCGFITVGAHGQRSAGVEVFTPVFFEGQEEPPPGEGPGENPGEDPDDPGENPGEEPGDVPVDPCEAETPDDLLENEEYAVQGEALAGTEATMTVTPGRYLPCDDVTEVTVEGTAYNPEKPVYVGFGTPQNHDDLEQWRRSNGGLSGPEGDYDYGVPRLVVANGSSDGDVADAEMDPNGDWSLTVEIPGKDVDSFFGGAIDCAVAYCGFFSFGAHGTVVAENEAYTPVYFGGQDPDGTPPPGPGSGDGPTQVPGGTSPGDGPPDGAQPAGLGTVPDPSGANAGLEVNGGLAATGAGDQARTTMIGGLLLLSAGLLGAALTRNRRLSAGRTD